MGKYMFCIVVKFFLIQNSALPLTFWSLQITSQTELIKKTKQQQKNPKTNWPQSNPSISPEEHSIYQQH